MPQKRLPRGTSAAQVQRGCCARQEWRAALPLPPCPSHLPRPSRRQAEITRRTHAAVRELASRLEEERFLHHATRADCERLQVGLLLPLLLSELFVVGAAGATAASLAVALCGLS